MSDLKDALAVLELPPKTTRSEVRKAYRRLLKVWHLDRFTGDPDLQAEAEEKTKRITLAYGTVMDYLESPHQTAAEAASSAEGYRQHGWQQADEEEEQQPAADEVQQGEREAQSLGVLLKNNWGFCIAALFLVGLWLGKSPTSTGEPTATFQTPSNTLVARSSWRREMLIRSSEVEPEAGEPVLTSQPRAVTEFDLAEAYADGDGVPQDDAEAVRWYRLAADQGYAEAQASLGSMYAIGRGVRQDDAEAVRWYQLAAEQGHAEAQYNLGGMYENGRGVPEDHVQGHMWYNLAASRGVSDAVKDRDRLESRVPPAQIAEAQRLAREWDAAHPREP